MAVEPVPSVEAPPANPHPPDDAGAIEPSTGRFSHTSIRPGRQAEPSLSNGKHHTTPSGNLANASGKTRTSSDVSDSATSTKSRSTSASIPVAKLSVMTPIASQFAAAAGERGRALSERLRGITANAVGFVECLRLGQVRGTTGTIQEGMLKEEPDKAFMCCSGSNKVSQFFAIKGPWMLRFKKDKDSAVAFGVPIPLDGATVMAIGELEFEVSNVHVKDEFYGKEALLGIHKDARKTFEHSVQKQFEAPSQEARDEWVQKLQCHIGMLKECLARKMQNLSKEVPRTLTTGTAAEVNSSSAALFAQFELELEVEVFKLQVSASDVITPGYPSL